MCMKGVSQTDFYIIYGDRFQLFTRINYFVTCASLRHPEKWIHAVWCFHLIQFPTIESPRPCLFLFQALAGGSNPSGPYLTL